MGILKFKHSLNSGDLIGNMAGIQHACNKTGKKAVIYQRLNMDAQYYAGAVHPVQTETGKMVCMNDKQWSMLAPLISAQPYVDHVDEWVGQAVDIDYDQLLEGNFANKPYGILQRWGFYVAPALACDLSQPYIHVPQDVPRGNLNCTGKIVVNLTERYRNPVITYFFLKEYYDHVIFAGTEGEYKLFREQNKLDVPYLSVNNFMELALALATCKLFIGNQSMCYHIAEGMKIPRVLELCNFAPNTFPIGADGYDFFNQQSLEHYVKTLFNS